MAFEVGTGENKRFVRFVKTPAPTKRLAAVINVELFDALTKTADAMQVPKTQVIEEAIELYITRKLDAVQTEKGEASNEQESI